MFERILVCLDGSKLAEQILPYATEEAIGFESKLILIQVMSMPTSVFMASTPTVGAPAQTGEIIKAEIQRQEAETKIYLDGVAQTLLGKGLDIESIILGASPAGEAIVKYAQDNSINLICIATHGYSGLGRLVLGSVADQVLRESGLPVLMIKPKEIEK